MQDTGDGLHLPPSRLPWPLSIGSSDNRDHVPLNGRLRHIGHTGSVFAHEISVLFDQRQSHAAARISLQQ